MAHTTEMTEDEKKCCDPLIEGNLWAIWRASQAFRPTRINWLIAIITFAITFCGALRIVNHVTITTAVRSVADSALNLAVSILGFLIAGYTILASTSNLDMLKKMALLTDPVSKLSVLKANFFPIVVVFVEFLILAIACFLIKLVGFTDGPISEILNVFKVSPCFRSVLVRFALASLGAFTVFALMQLKSVVFNVHHYVMTSVAHSLVDDHLTDSSRQFVDI